MSLAHMVAIIETRSTTMKRTIQPQATAPCSCHALCKLPHPIVFISWCVIMPHSLFPFAMSCFPSGWRLLSHFLLYLSLHLHGGKSPLKDLIEVQRSSLHRSSTSKLPSKRNKLGFLTHKYELFTIEEGEDIQCMSSSFQTILNKLRSLGWNFDNYDHIDKILRSLSRKWRPHATST